MKGINIGAHTDGLCGCLVGQRGHVVTVMSSGNTVEPRHGAFRWRRRRIRIRNMQPTVNQPYRRGWLSAAAPWGCTRPLAVCHQLLLLALVLFAPSAWSESPATGVYILEGWPCHCAGYGPVLGRVTVPQGAALYPGDSRSGDHGELVRTVVPCCGNGGLSPAS